MAQGLLGGVLPAIYSGADQLKRGVYGLLTNPMEQAERAGQSLLQSRADRQALMARTFANPERPFQVTDQAGLAQLGDQVMSGELGFAPAGITAFHGTPHNILGKFDVSKIGTGEGNQSFGHGMYFAENPNVAKHYQQALGKWIDRVKIGNTEMSVFDAMSKYADEGVDAAKVLERMKTKGQLSIDQYNNMIQDVVIPEIRTNAKIPQEKWGDVEGLAGNLYKVDIPDEYVPTMMNWDKPLGEQSAFVKKAINSLKKQVTPEMKMELGDDLNLLFGKDVTPAQFLNTWEIIHPTGGVGIGEKLLNEQGVKGIRYLDNPSRDAGKGTSNFVVFDPTDVKILERNNQPIEGLLD
jgi:hypothetical protein